MLQVVTELVKPKSFGIHRRLSFLSGMDTRNRITVGNIIDTVMVASYLALLRHRTE